MKESNLNPFISKIENSISDRTIIKLTISNRNCKENKLLKVFVKLIEIKHGVKLSFVYRYATNDITKNFGVQKGINIIVNLLNDFSNAILFTCNEDTELIISKKGFELKQSNPKFQETPSLKHDHQKNWIR